MYVGEHTQKHSHACFISPHWHTSGLAAGLYTHIDSDIHYTGTGPKGQLCSHTDMVIRGERRRLSQILQSPFSLSLPPSSSPSPVHSPLVTPSKTPESCSMQIVCKIINHSLNVAQEYYNDASSATLLDLYKKRLKRYHWRQDVTRFNRKVSVVHAFVWVRACVLWMWS